MKIACIILNSNLINCTNQNKTLDYLKRKLYEIGEQMSLISYFNNSMDNLKNIFNDKYDLIFVIGTNNPMYNYNIKDNLSRIFGDKLLTNPNAYDNLKKYCVRNNITFSIEEENEVALPSLSIPLIMEDQYNTGFMYKFNDKYCIFLPEQLHFCEYNYINFISNLINDIISNNSEVQIIKCFGILEKDIRNIISEYFSIENISINIASDDIDNTIYIRYQKDFDRNKLQNLISDIISKLNKFIYALEDISISQMACELLKIQNKTLAIGETITYGMIARELAEVNANFIANNIYFSKYADILDKLDIDRKVIATNGEYSVNAIYEMANAMLENSSCDIVLFTLGQPESDYCLMAVGDIDGIHVYKNKISNNSSDITDNLTKTAFFYLIKKLKQNDLHFN